MVACVVETLGFQTVILGNREVLILFDTLIVCYESFPRTVFGSNLKSNMAARLTFLIDYLETLPEIVFGSNPKWLPSFILVSKWPKGYPVLMMVLTFFLLQYSINIIKLAKACPTIQLYIIYIQGRFHARIINPKIYLDIFKQEMLGLYIIALLYRLNRFSHLIIQRN